MQQVARKNVRKTKSGSPRARVAFLITAVLSVTILTLLTWWIVGLVKQTVLSGLVNTINVQQGTLEARTPIEAYVFRDERIVVAPEGGKIRRLVSEGERVRVGKPIVEIVVPSLDNAAGSKTITVRAPEAGVVSYRIDGLENLYSLDNLQKLPIEATVKLATDKEEEKTEQEKGPEDKVGRGQGVFKLINNLNPGYVYIKVAKSQIKAETLQQASEVSLYLGQGNKHRTPFAVKSLNQEGEYYRLILGTNNLPLDLYQPRKINPDLITGRFNGYLLPEKSLVYKDGQPGLYLVYKTAVIWEPVKIVGQVDGDIAIIANPEKLPKGAQSQISPNASVVINPGYVKEGQAVNQ